MTNILMAVVIFLVYYFEGPMPTCDSKHSCSHGISLFLGIKLLNNHSSDVLFLLMDNVLLATHTSTSHERHLFHAIEMVQQ